MLKPSIDSAADAIERLEILGSDAPPVVTSDLRVNNDDMHPVGAAEHDYALSVSLARYQAHLAAGPRSKEAVFILDSGASSHMTPLREVLVDVNPCGGEVSLGDMNVKLRIKARGHSRLPGLGHFRWVPQLSFSLISIPALNRIGCRTVIYDGDVLVTHRGRTICTSSS
jgi:hypothetical protein